MKNQSIVKRFGFAWNGIRIAFSEESSSRWQILGAIVAYGILIGFQASPIWWAMFTLSAALVLGSELLNSALERCLDRLHPEIHPMIGDAKDCAAGAVLVFSFASIFVVIAFLFDHFS